MFLAKPENDREWSEINLDGKSKIEIGEEDNIYNINIKNILILKYQNRDR